MNDSRTTPTESTAGEPLDGARPDVGVTDNALAKVHAQRGALVRLAYRLVWNLDDAEDAVQDALVRAAERREQLADTSRAWSWVRAIVVRQCHDLRRRTQRGTRAMAAIEERKRDDSAPPQAHELVAGAELNDRVRAAIAALPERQQSVLVLRHLEELSYPEIAELLGMSESTVRVQVRNARESLCRMLKEA
ncbi:MAG: RNA polymerase sigma factor [Phycisphaerales bacterium]|nr:RNA polymerase sigma factor [Phycisphaerales bacterium]